MKKYKILTNFDLKMLAIFSMVLDHIGAVFFPEYIVFRIIGRIAFPIFSFLLIQGYTKTSNLNKYLFRLLVFALISEIPFNLAFYNNIFSLEHQNIFFTLFTGLIALKSYDILSTSKYYKYSILPIIILAFISDFLKFDYGSFGIILIFLIYKTKKPIYSISIVNIVNVLFYPIYFTQIFAILAIIPIKLYNGKRGKNYKYLFYIIYPLHLLIISIIN